MPLFLEEFEECKYSAKCPFNSSYSSNQCQGALITRKSKFTCDLVDDNGNFKSMNEGFRSSHDETGKMKIIMETKIDVE